MAGNFILGTIAALLLFWLFIRTYPELWLYFLPMSALLGYIILDFYRRTLKIGRTILFLKRVEK